MGRLQEDFKTRVSLAALVATHGELWKDAYIDVAPLTIKALPALKNMKVTKGAKDLNDLGDEDLGNIITMVKSSFIGGKVVFQGKLVDAEANDIEDLPMEVINDVIEASTGKLDPKS